MSTNNQMQSAPELSVSRWFNTDEPITLEKLRGKIVVIEAFQMLCPGCVSHGLPQAQQIAALFPRNRVAVLGLHTVFEHHAAMTPVSLEAFIHEYRFTIPIGVDAAGPDHIPRTMEAYRLRGTPSLILVDQFGMLRASHFGQVSDLQIGAEIATLLSQSVPSEMARSTNEADNARCNEVGCSLDETSVP